MPSLDSRTAERLLATFLDLVRIDSPSGEEAACAAYCAEALRAAGCSVRFDQSAALTGSDTGNLIAELPGTVEGTLVLSAHLDCVEPCRGVEPVVSDGIVTSSGETVLGGDDKVGLAAAIECVRILAERGGSHPTVRCVFTVQEEVGLLGAKNLDPADVSADLCLVLDADGTPGGIIVGAPTHYTFDAEFTGKAAHAGVAPETGISAIRMATEAISRLPIGRIDEITTANVGTISGGTATNVITARVTITGECRSLDADVIEALRQEMDSTMRAAAQSEGGTVEVAWHCEYPGFRVAEDAPVLDVVRDACALAGLEARTLTTGGGSDANVISGLGVPTLALSCGMTCVHGTAESVATADIESLVELCVAVAERMARDEG